MNAPLFNQDWDKSYDVFRNRIVPQLKSIPGVQEVAAVNSVPMSLGSTEHSRYATRFGIVDRVFAPGQFPTAQTRWCTPEYFRILGIRLASGQLLAITDHGQPRCVVNRALARRFFPNENVVGQRLLMDVMKPHPVATEIVGVVNNVRELGLDTARPNQSFIP